MREGWRVARLGGVCSFEKEQNIHVGLPYVGLENIESGTGRFLGAENSVSVKSATFRFTAAHVLYGRLRPYLNKVLLPEFEGHCSTEIFPILAGREVLREYLFHWLSTDATVNLIDATSTGARMPRANMNAVLDFEIPVPPLPEQRRIVSILDEAFEAIATAKANTERNLRNARELFEGHHQAVLERAGEGTAYERLGDFASFRNGINYTKQSRGRTVRIIGVKDFQNHFWAPLDDLDSVTLDGDLSPADRVAEGDILAVRSNGNPALIGRCMTVGRVADQVTHSGFTIRITVRREKAFPSYVCQFMRSRAVRRKLIDGGNGLNIKSLNQGMLSEIIVPLPTIAMQQKAVAGIEQMAIETSCLADVVARKLSALDELKKSLLHQAFSGVL